MKIFWRTKDGREIPIPEMEDSHLINTITYLRRKAPYFKATEVAATLILSEPNGEAAADAFESECVELENASCEDVLARHVPQYEHLVAEAELRGLPVPLFDEHEANEQCEQAILGLASTFILNTR